MSVSGDIGRLKQVGQGRCTRELRNGSKAPFSAPSHPVSFAPRKPTSKRTWLTSAKCQSRRSSRKRLLPSCGHWSRRIWLSEVDENMVVRTYGTVSAERQKAMSGLEFVKGLVDGELPLNTIAQTLGYDIVEAESGGVVITLVPTGAHLNPAGTVHGGLTATLLDSCMGLAVWTMLDKGITQTTLEFKISLVRPITVETGLIRAEGTVLNTGRRIGTAEGRVTDSNGRLLAHGTTTCLIFQS